MMALKQITQRVNPNPNTIRVEIRMAADILRILAVIGMDLTHLTQHQAPSLAIPHHVAALAVGFRTHSDLSHERCASILKILGQGTRRPRAEIIRIGDEQVTHALVPQHVKQT